MVKVTLDSLAGMIQNQFSEQENKFNKRFDKVDSDIKELKQGQENIELKLSNVAYRFELEEVKQRVMVLEKKIGVK